MLAAALLGPIALTVPAAQAEESRAPLAPIDLGTLVPRLQGKVSPVSIAEAISGDIVVGRSVVGRYPPNWVEEMQEYNRRPKYHAFTYDLTSPEAEMIDLGTLGGAASWAVDVEGGVVVGTSATEGGRNHAFAYDLNAEHPRMIDLGTLGGAGSEATAVDDGIVVGNSWVDGANHAFAYDLNAPSPTMIDLGILRDADGDTAQYPDVHATGVNDGVVIGHGWAPNGEHHVWAYDLNASSPEMRDLGTLGEPPTRPSAVNDGIVLGSSVVYGEEGLYFRAFAYDLSRPDAVMQDLGAVFGENSVAVDYEAGWIVGSGWTQPTDGVRLLAWKFGTDEAVGRDLGRLGGGPGRVIDVDGTGLVTGVTSNTRFGELRAFASDLNSESGEVTDLGNVGHVWDLSGIAVDNGVMAGTADGRAMVWPLTETVRLKRSTFTVSEASRTARVTVTRTGELGQGLSVDYASTSGSARAGRDFEPVRGTVTFAPGEVEASFTVPVVDDRRAERRETIRVRLGNPTAGVRFLGASAGQVVIAASDQRPDVQLSRERRAHFVGDDVYNKAGRRQAKVVRMRRGETVGLFARLQNDGNARTAYTVRQATTPARVRVRYFHGQRNVTRAVTSKSGWRVAVRPGRSRLVKVELHVFRRASVKTKIVKLAGVWTGDRRVTDAVKAIVRIVP